MSRVGRERVEAFLRELEEAVGGAQDQRDEISDEVRADLDEHMSRFEEEGCSEDEAVERALSEMGNPYELGYRMRSEVPPFSSGPVRVVRYLICGVIIAWVLLLTWGLRGMGYGPSPVLYLLFWGMPLPVIALLWPKIVWKRNWMYSISLGTAAAIAIVSLSFMGQKSELSYTLMVAEGPALEGPVDLDGVVQSSDGQPVEGALVSWDRGPERTWGLTGPDGGFSFIGLPDGELMVSVAVGELGPEWFTVEEGELSPSLVLSISHAEAAALVPGESDHLESDGSGGIEEKTVPLTAGFSLFVITLLFSMQQSSQRKGVLLALLAGFAVVEVPYQLEELTFRQDVAKVGEYLEGLEAEGRSLPVKEVLEQDLAALGLWNNKLRIPDWDYGLNMWWPRPLSDSCSIGYDFDEDRIWVQD